MSFASTFLNPNSVIQTERKSILYCKLQVIVTLLEATNQNARAVSLPPGCLSLDNPNPSGSVLDVYIIVYIYIYIYICMIMYVYG